MPNFDSSLIECLGFSQIIISAHSRVSIALPLISDKFPIGVATMYNPLSILTFLHIILFTFLFSCAPAINTNEKTSENLIKESNNPIQNQSIESDINKKITSKDIKKDDFDYLNPLFLNEPIDNTITLLITKKNDKKIVSQFLNVIEFTVYNKKLDHIYFDIKIFEDSEELNTYLKKESKVGKIFIGPFDSSDTKDIHKFCDDGVIFFSFSSETNLAKKCIYLFNFFPENEIETLFKNFPENSKIALLFPENLYGYSVNKIVDRVAEKSDSIIVNRASYNKDLSNVRNAIKELGKYELRKYELNRQKQILATKKDDISKKRLKKLEKFSTTNDYDFTHILIADYGIRLLQVAPLLAYYDVDPNIVTYVGTGAWDDKVFFDEPSLQGGIFPGIEFLKREKLIKNYKKIYEENLMRVSTLPYDLVGLFSYLVKKNYSLGDSYKLLNNKKTRFEGIDGNFYFNKNIVKRDLSILKISNGKALKLITQE